MNIRDKILILYGILLLFILFKLSRVTEGMTDVSVGSNITLNDEAVSSIASLYNTGGTLTVPNLRVTGKIEGDLVVDGQLNVKNGSRFEGGRHLFKDEESVRGNNNAGWLRVGCAWGKPGIYSEEGPLYIGGQNNWIETPYNNLKVHKQLSVHNGSRFQGERHLFKDEEDKEWLRVGAVEGIPGITNNGAADGSHLPTQIGPWTVGTQTLENNYVDDKMLDGRKYNYLKSIRGSNAVLNNDNTTTLANVNWNNNHLYHMYFVKNRRYGHNHGAYIDKNWRN